jgi:hypothetical protein
MQTYKLNNVFNAAAIMPAVLGLASAIFMVYVFWWPPKPAYQSILPNEHRVTYQDGYIRIHRVYCVNAKVPITITRDLIRIDGPGAPEFRVTLPQTSQSYELGCHEIERIFDVPRGTPPGNYRMVNTAVWAANPFRDESTVLPILSIAIPPMK